MATRDYSRMEIEDFGKVLLESGDLDPVYIALKACDWPPATLYRWLIAYWCCYHPGASSYIAEAEGSHFWNRLFIAAANLESHPAPGRIGRWPRAAERRHWRGRAATDCVDKLQKRYGDRPGDMVEYIGWISDGNWKGPHRSVSYKHVYDRTLEHPLFGPWIAYKVADMLERVVGVPVQFGWDDAMYDSPTQAALMLARSRMNLPEKADFIDPKGTVRRVVEHMLVNFNSYDAPAGGRKVGLQEVETILCKWKSHMSGHYPLYNDLVEIRHGLGVWTPHSQLAAEFLAHMPVVPQTAAQAA